MASVNKVILVGNLGRDPEVRDLNSGNAAASFSVATTDNWKDKNGQKQERTEWHRITMYGKLAEIAGEYLKKGSSVYIEGRLQTRKWQDKEGKERQTTEVVADRMQMLGGGNSSGGSNASTENRQQKPQAAAAAPSGGNGAPSSSGFDDFDDDIPFAANGLEHDVIYKSLNRTSSIRKRS